MFAESSASDLFRKFMGNETNCSTNQMARKPMNVNKNQLLGYESWLIKIEKEIYGLLHMIRKLLSVRRYYRIRLNFLQGKGYIRSSLKHFSRKKHKILFSAVFIHLWNNIWYFHFYTIMPQLFSDMSVKFGFTIRIYINVTVHTLNRAGRRKLVPFGYRWN